MESLWKDSHRGDKRALPLADRHYNRQKPGSPQFVPPGRCLVFLTEEADALWVTSWPYAKYVMHQWAGAWVNSLFRNESPYLSSELIKQAVRRTREIWPDIPEQGLVTFIDSKKIRSTNPGCCYKKAGFKHVGFTKRRGYYVLQLLPKEIETV